MAANSLTPEQDLMFRSFYTMLQGDPTILSTSPAHRRQMLAICLEGLNYIQLPSGAYVAADTNIKVSFGNSDYSAYPNEWEVDMEVALDAAVDLTSELETSASSPSEDTEVRETLLPKDV